MGVIMESGKEGEDGEVCVSAEVTLDWAQLIKPLDGVIPLW